MSANTVDPIAAVKRATTHLYKPVSQRTLEDYQPFFASLHDAVVLQYATPRGASEMRGKQTVVDYVTRLFESLGGAECEADTELATPLELLSNGDRVVALWREHKRNRKTGVTSDCQEVAVIHEFRDGKISRLLRFNT